MSERLSESLCSLLVNGAVCVQDHKGLMWRNRPNSSTSALSAGMKWHQWPNCHFSFCSGHNYNIPRPQMMFTGSWSGRPRRWAPTTAGSDRVWSSHLYVSNRHSPPGRSVLRRLPKENCVCSRQAVQTRRSRVLGPKKLESSVGGSPPRWPTTHNSCVRA